MTREEAKTNLNMIRVAFGVPVTKEQRELVDETFEMAIQALSQEPTEKPMTVDEMEREYEKSKALFHKIVECDDAISREAAINIASLHCLTIDETVRAIKNLPSVTQKSGKCKNCKYFEYDSVAKVDGIPLIVAHEICNKWGDGCKTSEDGYCYLFEPQESEE